MPKTANKGIRFTEEELGRADALLTQFPEFRSQAEVLHQAALIGLLLLATQAIRPGLEAYAGYRPDDLAALLKYRLLPAIDFLIARDALPVTVQRPAGGPAAPPTHVAVGNPDTALLVPDAAAGLDELGTNFLE
jgi:hypothetical protein